MSLTLLLNQPQVSVGLPTFTYTVPTGGAGLYNVQAQSTEGPVSGVSILVKNNGSTKYTAPTLSPTQGAVQFRFPILLADSDVVTVVMASANAVDNQLNSVVTTCSIGQGA